MLDLEDDNPVSRIPKSTYKDVVNMKIELSLQNNINVTQAKKKKEDLLRKKLDEQERRKRVPVPRPPKRTVMTPKTEDRINKMHRGKS
jgi:hypothetical protein